MKRWLDGFYKLCSALSCLLMAAIATLILASALARPLGLVVPDANALAGFCFAALTFLALAPTLRSGGHIRVNVIITLIPSRIRQWIELWCLAVALALVAYLAYWTVHLVIQSWSFGDVSTGVLAVPLWIPQAAMALGAIALTLALLENLIMVARGHTPDYEQPADAGAHTE